MAVYAQFDGMDGQAMDKGYEKWCILHEYTINASRNLMAGGAAQQSQQRVTGSTQLGPIMLRKNVDKADPKLLAAALGGKIVKKVMIVETVTIGGKSEINSQYELADVLVTSIVTAGDGKSNQSSLVGLMPTGIKFKFQEIDTKDGSVKGSVEGEYDANTLTAK